MQLRVQLWWACLAVALSGLAYFFVADVIVLHPAHQPSEMTGGQIIAETWGEAWDSTRRFVREAVSEGEHMLQMRPREEVWIGVGTAVGLAAPLALRNRPTGRARVLLALVSLSVLVVVVIATSGFVRFDVSRARPGLAYWVWLGSLALLCASPWLRRREQFETLAAWERRPHPPNESLPPLAHMPAPFAILVEETRAVRVSLDVLAGLDRDTRQLLWEWCHRVDTCGPDEAALLAELGLGSEPVREVTAAAGAPGPLFTIDAALARFERALLDYRSYAFR